MSQLEDTPNEFANTALRLIVHVLLAIFLAQAANKFFIADLDYELTHQFYKRIFYWEGDAPDQYRILPLLPLKLLCYKLPFNHAVLVYNTAFGFAVLELQWLLSRGLGIRWRWAASFGLAILYIYSQYTGWRPDTMGLLLICYGAALLLLAKWRDSTTHWLAWGGILLLLSASRSDIALIYALFATFYRKYSYGVWIGLPIAAQIILQSYVFPDAAYYTKQFMLLDNLGGHYLLQNPATYLIFASVLAFWRPIRAFVSATIRKNYYFYLLIAGYLILVLVMGRINEYRLYLPFLPLLLVVAHGNHPQQRAK